MSDAAAFAAASPAGFVAGFAARHDAAAPLLERVFAPPAGFAEADPKSWVAPVAPCHFAPADASDSPTAGWNPLDPEAETTAFLDPIRTAHAAGYAEGLAAAAVAARAAEDRDAALVDGLAIALAADARLDREGVARRLRDTVLSLVAKLVGENGVAPDLLAQRIEAATGLIADSTESVMLRVHPDDVTLLAGRLPDAVFTVGDVALARGSFTLESASTLVEDGPALWLDQLAEAIERVPVPC